MDHHTLLELVNIKTYPKVILDSVNYRNIVVKECCFDILNISNNDYSAEDLKNSNVNITLSDNSEIRNELILKDTNTLIFKDCLIKAKVKVNLIRRKFSLENFLKPAFGIQAGKESQQGVA